MCLADKQQHFVPDTQERATLQIAGLGEKRITTSCYSDAFELNLDLIGYFPKLRDAGGYELLRVREGGGKELDVISSPESGYTAQYLKAVVHSAKIYIKPLQKNLSLEPVVDKVVTIIIIVAIMFDPFHMIIFLNIIY